MSNDNRVLRVERANKRERDNFIRAPPFMWEVVNPAATPNAPIHDPIKVKDYMNWIKGDYLLYRVRFEWPIKRRNFISRGINSIFAPRFRGARDFKMKVGPWKYIKYKPESGSVETSKTEPPLPGDSSSSGKGIISGNIIGFKNIHDGVGHPISGAEVILCKIDNSSKLEIIRIGDPSNDKGFFKFEVDKVPERYYIISKSPGYKPFKEDGREGYAWHTDMKGKYQGKPLFVDEKYANQYYDVLVPLLDEHADNPRPVISQKKVILSGHVWGYEGPHDNQGHPVPGANVRLCRLDNGRVEDPVDKKRDIISNGDGYFKFEVDTRAEKYYIKAKKTGEYVPYIDHNDVGYAWHSDKGGNPSSEAISVDEKNDKGWNNIRVALLRDPNSQHQANNQESTEVVVENDAQEKALEEIKEQDIKVEEDEKAFKKRFISQLNNLMSDYADSKAFKAVDDIHKVGGFEEELEGVHKVFKDWSNLLNKQFTNSHKYLESLLEHINQFVVDSENVEKQLASLRKIKSLKNINDADFNKIKENLEKIFLETEQIVKEVKHITIINLNQST